MTSIPTEHASGFGEHLNQRFRDDLGLAYRVLCLSLNQKSVLMWGHYAHSHSGIAIGLDVSVDGFPQGLKQGGFDIDYTKDRSKTKLPLAFYQEPPVEGRDLHGNIVNLPDEEVISDGGLIIPYREYRRQMDQAGITALSTKAEDWRYEQEVRFIYDRPQQSSQLVFEHGRHFVQIPPKGLCEIIVGFRANVNIVKGIVRLYREGKIGNPKFYFSECHPYLYEVQAHETNDDYLLKYFEVVLPSMQP